MNATVTMKDGCFTTLENVSKIKIGNSAAPIEFASDNISAAPIDSSKDMTISYGNNESFFIAKNTVSTIDFS